MSVKMNPSSDDSTDEEDVIRDFEKEAQLVIDTSTLPKKSQERYNLVYETFIKWKNENKATAFEESVLICYFKDLQKRVGPATLWSVWSILKKMLNLRHKVDIGNFYNLKSILKLNSKDYKPKKSLTFTWDQITKFIDNASDDIYLGAKVLLIFGICGALRSIEFTNIKCSDVEDISDRFIVSIHDTKTYIDRSFIIGPLFYSKVKQYILMKPQDQFTDRFFIQYANRKCHRQVMGKNKIGSVPATIASFLNLENHSRYTGHCFRRTSATLLSNSGANMTMIKQLGGWRSDTVASGYIADSMKSKTLIYQGIIHETKSNSDLQATTSNSKDNSLHIIKSSDFIDPKMQVQELDLRYEDFCDESLSPQEPCDLQNFKTGNGKELQITMPLKPHNEKDSGKLFTRKSPIKLSFAKSSKTDSTDVLPPKKVKLEEILNSSSSKNITPIQVPLKENNGKENANFVCNEAHQMVTKDSTVKFDNCTISGNITNNYYYYGSH